MRIVSSVCSLIVLTLPSDRRALPQAASRPDGTDVRARRITWQDVGADPRAPRGARVLRRQTSPRASIASLTDNARRVHLGDLDHLVFFALQSTRFTSLPSIEPALSAKSLVDGLDAAARDAFFGDPASARGRVSHAVRARLAAFLRATASPADDARLAYFGRLLGDEVPAAREREAALIVRVPPRDAVRVREGVRRRPIDCSGCGRPVPHPRPEHRHRRRGRIHRQPGTGRAARPRPRSPRAPRPDHRRRARPRAAHRAARGGAAAELSTVGGPRRAGRRSGCRASTMSRSSPPTSTRVWSITYGPPAPRRPLCCSSPASVTMAA